MKRMTKKIVKGMATSHSLYPAQMTVGSLVDFEWRTGIRSGVLTEEEVYGRDSDPWLERRAEKNARRWGWIDQYGRLTHAGWRAI